MPTKAKIQSIRLPSHIRPDRYRIMLKPDLEGFTFSGEEVVYFDINKPTGEITLHAVDLEISEVEFKNTQSVIRNPKIVPNPKNETVTFKLPKKVPVGKGELSLKFKGVLSDKLKGFYRSRYTHEGQEQYIATTQFEATDARRAFPCFDEPAHKAVFDVTMMVPQALTAVSNTIETSIMEHESGYKLVQFAPTPKMSTYLLAFIVGDFEFIESKTNKGVLVRVFTTKGKSHQGKFALKTAVKALEFYEEYFDIAYPLPVLDLIAIPDFASAAMENWGAVTYRESALLVDDEHTSAANKQWVAIVVAHELAHQWFGNLVTMHWWTDLWLNEGFASYMEYLAVDQLYPDWHMWDQYVSERFAVALRLDALSTSHPIEIEVHHPDEISEIFDQVSYAKGSTVIRMLAEYLGPETFRDGLRHYLKKYQYGNTKTEDLWRSFEAASGKPVRKLMKEWTSRTGYPLLEAVQKKKGYAISQQRYFSSEISRKRSKDKGLWSVPLSILRESGDVQQLLLTKKETAFPEQDGWFKLNHRETSLVRVKYPQTVRQLLEPAIAGKVLPPSDRLGIIRDAFGLAEAGQGSTVDALELARFYAEETELPVWEEVAAGIASAGEFYMSESWFDAYERFARSVFGAITAAMGWERKSDEGHTHGLLRSLSLMQYGAYGDKTTINRAKQLFKNAAAGVPVPADLRGVVYNLTAMYGGQKEFKTLVKMYKAAAQHHEEQDRIGRAMGSFRDSAILKDVLEFALSDAVRPQDSPSIFIFAARNHFGRQEAWKFLKANWKGIYERYNIGGHLLEWFVTPFSRFATEAKAKEFEQFFKKHPAPNIARTIQQVTERIRSNAAWVKRDKNNIKKWVKGQV